VVDAVERGRVDTKLDALDGEPFNLEHLDPNPVDGERVAHLRDPLETVEDQAGHCVVFAVGKIESSDSLDLVRTRRRGNGPDARFGLDMIAGGTRVVLVLDVANEFFDNVFERDNAGGTAVLVDHDRHLGRSRPQLGQHDVQSSCFWHRKDLVRQLGHCGGLVVGSADSEQVFGVHDARYMTLDIDHREPRMRRRHQVAEVGSGGVGVDGHHAVPGDHCVRSFELTEVDRPLEECGLTLAEMATLGRRVDNQIEFLGGNCAAQFLHRLDTDEAEQPVRGTVEQTHDRTSETQKHPHRLSERSCDRFGLRDRQVLRREFAEHHLRHRRQDQRQRERDTERCRFGNPDRHQRRFDHCCDRRLGDEAHEQCGDRDAELSTREHEAQALVNLDCPLRAAVTLVGSLDEPAPTSGHERELDGDEEPIGRDERNHCDQPESSQHGVNFVFGRQTWVSRCYRPSWSDVATARSPRTMVTRMSTFHDFEMTSITGDDMSFDRFEDQICLIVNVASA